MSEIGWSEQTSREFLEYGDFFVPEREEQLDVICSLLAQSSASGTVLDLCCGGGGLARAMLEHNSEISVCGLDGSPAMLASAARELASFGTRFRTASFDLADTSWRTTWQDCCAVVSSLAIHHLDDDQKRQLFTDVLGMLAPGGAFVLADLCEPGTGPLRALAARQWDDAVRRRSREVLGDLSAFTAFQRLHWNYFVPGNDDPDFDHPSSVVDQLVWLREAGFEAVDVAWAKAGHAVLCGYRSA